MYLEESTFALPETILEELDRRWKPELRTEEAPLAEAAGRVLARTLYSRNTLPVCRSADGDGIAVRGADFAGGGLPDPSGWVMGRDYAMADTGDDFDDAFDTVIRIESLEFREDGGFSFRPGLAVEPGQMVSAGGGNLKRDELLLSAGAHLTPQQVGLLASGGYTAAPVYRKPVVAYIPTGSELILPGETPERGQNIQSNGAMLQAALAAWNAEMLPYPIIRDDRAAIGEAFRDALQKADIVMLSGGSSKGSEDFTAHLMEEGSSYFQHGVQTVPGRPAGVGLVDDKPVIALPGPPFGAFLVLDWCVRALVYRLQNTRPPQRPAVKASITEDVKKPPFPYRYYVRARVTGENGEYTAEPLAMDRRSAQVAARCNGLVVVPAECGGYRAGDTVLAELLGNL